MFVLVIDTLETQNTARRGYDSFLGSGMEDNEVDDVPEQSKLGNSTTSNERPCKCDTRLHYYFRSLQALCSPKLRSWYTAKDERPWHSRSYHFSH